MPITPAIEALILANGNAMDIAAQAELDGVNSLRRSGLMKVRQGMTSLEEVLGCTNE
jgi:type IV pilus assembly protein PilB